MLEQRRIALADGSTVSAVVAFPAAAAPGARTAVVLAHGAGSDMRGALLSAVHTGLAARGYVTVKFNFPYTEAGRRAPDPAARLQACYRAVLDAVRVDPRVAAARVVIGGKSLGGRMASHLAADGAPVAGLIFLGYPLHPPGRPEKLRAAHLDRIRVPMLFFAGTRDPLCNLDLLRPVLDRLPAPVRLHIIEGGDHSFNLPKALRREPTAVWEEIVAAGARWLAELP